VIARWISAAALVALLAVQWAWRWQAAPSTIAWVLPALYSLPLLPPALGFVLRRPRAPLWAGIAALLYFCHGVAEARVSGGPWPWAEILLSLALVFAAGWPGIAAKIAKRRAPPQPNV
jgi:uncharacterized membrane protein